MNGLCVIEMDLPIRRNKPIIFAEAAMLVLARAKLDAQEGRASTRHFLCKPLHKIKTDTHLVSAFHTFGKYTGVSLPTGKRKIISNKRIGIQPTSLQRRQRAVPGLKRHGAGRPKKPSEGEIQACHEKGKSRNFSSLSGAHSLKHCVSQNTSLGGTHSKK
ncbi:uncharacterized protein LOC112555728 [Pomacea canaliculata]|uniref:uncharacterized protein LOC112555728 n=1 Tax=Pomacea canaliculata TaxID=400727 RepID=UPI000D7351E3|nr:uncharacterized protein LOC112555728 [Pomacea canaliculata]